MKEEYVATAGQSDDVVNKERRERIRNGYTGIQQKSDPHQQSGGEGSQGDGKRDEGQYRGIRQGVNYSSRDKREESHNSGDDHSSSKRSRDDQYESGSYHSSRYSEQDRDHGHERNTYH